MVYCTKCGTKNDPTQKYCKKCGAPLERSSGKTWDQKIEDWGEDFGRRAEKWSEDFGKRTQQECFSLAKSGAIIGLILGILIVIGGLLLLTGFPLLRYLSSIALIGFGLIILIIALKILTKKI
jgi:uncharacterized membrane protein YvbJ